MIKFTIIVPVFNRQNTIGRCIDSIKQQDYQNYECILVDDGSKDASLRICETYAGKDKRFKVLHKENGGVGSARNCGLSHATGEWIVFVDSDDTIKSTHLSSLLTGICEGVDMVFCGYTSEGHLHFEHSYKKSVYKGKEQVKEFLCNSDVISYMPICDRMFRNSTIKKYGLKFDPQLPISEDRLFSYNMLTVAEGVATVEGQTYVIDTSDRDSLSQRVLSVKVCQYRYEKLALATKKLIKGYNISGDDAYKLWEYIWALLTIALKAMYSVRANPIKVSRRQKEYFETVFPYDVYDNIKYSPRIMSLMSQKANAMIVDNKFLLYNLRIFFKYLVFKINSVFVGHQHNVK